MDKIKAEDENLDPAIVEFLKDNPIAYAEEMELDLSNYVDTDAMIQEAIDLEGRGHNLAGYDSEEHELDNDIYGYRRK